MNIKKEYFDKPEVQLFGETVSSSLDFRWSVNNQADVYLNPMFAIGILDWANKLDPDVTINNADDIEGQANAIARFILENSYHDHNLYNIIRQYFEWMCKVDCSEAVVASAMETHIIDHCIAICKHYKQFKEEQEK